MKTYRSVWMFWWALIGVFGAALSTTFLPVAGLMIVGLLGSGAGLLTPVLRRRSAANTSHDKPLDELVSAAGARACAGACCLLAIVGLSAFFGASAVVLSILAAITSPWFLRSFTGRFAFTTPPAPALPGNETRVQPISSRETTALKPPADMDLVDSIQALSYEGLCRTWRSTYLPVRVTDDAASLERLSALRRACLNELEQRDPAAFNSWLDTDPRAAGAPRKSLHKSRREEPHPPAPQ